MGFAFEKLPKTVRQAIESHDTEALSAAGKKGAEVTNNKKAEQQAIDDRLRERRDEEDRKMREQANEHIVPIESEDE